MTLTLKIQELEKYARVMHGVPLKTCPLALRNQERKLINLVRPALKVSRTRATESRDV